MRHGTPLEMRQEGDLTVCNANQLHLKPAARGFRVMAETVGRERLSLPCYIVRSIIHAARSPCPFCGNAEEAQGVAVNLDSEQSLELLGSLHVW